MKRFLSLTAAFALVIALLPSCSEDNDSAVSANSTCNCDDLRYEEVYNKMHVLDDEMPFTGTCELWHNPEQLKETRKYVDGKMEGEMKRWHPNGQLAHESTFKRNLQHGELKEYAPDGRLIRHARYENGQFTGPVESSQSTPPQE